MQTKCKPYVNSVYPSPRRFSRSRPKIFNEKKFLSQIDVLYSHYIEGIDERAKRRAKKKFPHDTEEQ